MTAATDGGTVANGFLERHRSLSTAGFLAFFVLLALSCVCLELTGAMPSIPQGTPAPLDMGLLTSDPCEPPCWQGLTPGVSTEQDVMHFLDTRQDYVDPCSVERNAHAGSILVTWKTTGRAQKENWFELHNGVLQLTNLHMDTPLTLGQLLEAFGPPDKYEAAWSLLPPEPVHMVVELFYGDLGLAPELYVAPDDLVLTESTPVVRTWLFEPGTLEHFCTVLEGEEGKSLPDYAVKWLEGWRDWPGYGAVEPTYQFGQE